MGYCGKKSLKKVNMLKYTQKQLDKMVANHKDYLSDRYGFSRRRLDRRERSFAGLKLKNVDLRLARFNGCDFTGATFENCTLNSIWFYSCNLSKATFKNCDLNNAILTNAKLSNVTFENTTLERTDFRNAKLFNTKLAR